MTLHRCGLSVVLGVGAFLLSGFARAEEDPVRSYLPADTEVVLLVNVRSLLGSALVKKNAPPLAGDAFTGLKLRAVKEVQQVVTACPAAAPERTTMVVRGKIDRAAFETETRDSLTLGRVKVHKTAAGSYYERRPPEGRVPGVPAPPALFYALVDETTLVLALGDEGPVKDALEIKAGQRKAADNKTLNDLLDQLDARDSANLVVCGAFKGKLPAGLVPEGLAPAALLFGQMFQGLQYEHLVGGVRLEDDLTVRLTATSRTTEAAHQLGEDVRDSLKQLRQVVALMTLTAPEARPLQELLQGLEVEEKGADVKVTGTLPATRASLLLRLVLPRSRR